MQSPGHTPLLRKGFSLAWNTAITLDWLARKPQGCSTFHLPSGGIVSTHHHLWHFITGSKGWTNRLKVWAQGRAPLSMEPHHPEERRQTQLTHTNFSILCSSWSQHSKEQTVTLPSRFPLEQHSASLKLAPHFHKSTLECRGGRQSLVSRVFELTYMKQASWQQVYWVWWRHL